MKNNLMLVTGAAGFVGGNLVRELVARGIPVRAMIHRPNGSDFLKELGVEIVQADLKDEATLRQAVEGVAGVYHIAALFRQADVPKALYYEVNAQGVRRMLDAAIAAGAKRFVHCSTIGVLGDVGPRPVDETAPYNPGDDYQRSKMEGEKIALEYFRSGRISGVVIRPAMIWGPGDTRMLKMFRMIARRRFFYVGRGDNMTHFVDVRDLARAFVLAMEHTERNGEIYIIAGREAQPLRKVVELIAGVLGVPPPTLCLPVRPMQWLGSLCEAVCVPFGVQPPIFRRRVDFFTKHRHFEVGKAARELGFQASKSLLEEIQDIVADYKARGWL